MLYEKAIENALTVLKNDRLIIPIRKIEKIKIAYVHMGDDTGTYFLNHLNKYAQVDWIKANSIADYIQKLKEYDLTIICVHKSNAVNIRK